MDQYQAKNFVANGVLIFLSLFVASAACLFALEFFLRWDASRVEDYKGYPHPGIYEENPYWGYNCRPGLHFQVKHREFMPTIRINSDGFRGGEESITKGVSIISEPKAIILGDSFMFGMSSADDDLLVNILAKQLPGWKFFNFAMPGWGGLEQLAVLDHFIEDIKPQVVLLAFFENDFADTIEPVDRYVVSQGYLFRRYCFGSSRKLQNKQIKELADAVLIQGVGIDGAQRRVQILCRGEDGKIKPGPWQGMKDRLNHHFRSYHFLATRLKEAITIVSASLPVRLQLCFKSQMGQVVNGIDNQSQPKGPPEEEKEKYSRIIVKMEELTLRNKAQFHAFLIPSKWLIDAPHDPYIDAAEQVFTQEGIEAYDMREFVRQRGGKSMYWEYDGHLRPEGHHLMAQHILAQGWFDPI